MIKPLTSYRDEELINAIISNTLTVKVGDAVSFVNTSGVSCVTNATNKTSGAYRPFGVVVGFATNSGGVYPTQGQDTSVYPSQIITTATNTTSELYNAVILPFREGMFFEIDADDTLGHTTLSDQKGVYFNLVDCRTIDESSVIASDDGSAPLQIFSLGPIFKSTTKVIGHFEKRRIQ